MLFRSHARESLLHVAKTDWVSRINNLLGDEVRVNQNTGPLERIVLRAAGRVTFLELKDLDWISAAGVYLHLHIGGKTHLYRSSINAFLQRLDPHRFVRIHRSTVVNTDRIQELRPRGHGDFTVVLHDGRDHQRAWFLSVRLPLWQNSGSYFGGAIPLLPNLQPDGGLEVDRYEFASIRRVPGG